MDLCTIVKLVDAGFTADEIRSWAVAKQDTLPPVTQSSVRQIRPAGTIRRANPFGAADLAEVPSEVSGFIKACLESSPGTAVVMYDELKECVTNACPDYKASVYRAVKSLFPTVAHKRQGGSGPYVLTDVAWRKK